VHDWLVETWYGGSRRGRWLEPLAWLFGGLAALRRRAYRQGLLRRYRSARPVVVIGNLTVGGTGKTPLIIWLAGELLARGLQVGIASRGYRGSGRPARRLGGNPNPAEVGDEAVLLARRLRVPVAVGASRSRAVQLLEPDCDVILCDDGLQHYALERDMEIAVVDGLRGVGNGRLLPAGPLREPPARLDEVDAVVVHGEGFAWPGALAMRLVPVAAVALAGGARRPLASFAGRKVHAFAAIGHPQRFFAMLRDQGLDIEEHPLPDHAVIAPDQLARADRKPALMTEKDAVKCADRLPDTWYVEVAAQVDGPGAARLPDRIMQLARQRHEGALTGG
jgi:tetraacyldisaccharide 4'-kinase